MDCICLDHVYFKGCALVRRRCLTRQLLSMVAEDVFRVYIRCAETFNNFTAFRALLTECEGIFKIPVMHVSDRFCDPTGGEALFAELMKRVVVKDRVVCGFFDSVMVVWDF